MENQDKTYAYACAEHIDAAIDDCVNFEERAPEVNKVSEGKCSYCGCDAEYEIK